MKAKQTYLKGKSVFTVSLFVIGITILTVYLSGENYQRTITSNFYMSLGIIGAALFLFMTYGLYKGVKLKDDFPKFKDYKAGEFVSGSAGIPDIPFSPSTDGIEDFIVSVLLWIAMSIAIFLLFVVLDVALWATLFILLTMLYWVFFRALRLVFSKSADSQGDIGISIFYALVYTTLYLGWIFGIVYLSQLF